VPGRCGPQRGGLGGIHRSGNAALQRCASRARFLPYFTCVLHHHVFKKDVTQVPYIKLEAHLEMCPLQVVSCRYACTGCSTTLPRCEMKAHEVDASVHMRGLLDSFVAERAAAQVTIAALREQLAIAHANISELRGSVTTHLLFTIPYRSRGQFADYKSAPFTVNGHEFTLSVYFGTTFTLNQTGKSWRGLVGVDLRRSSRQYQQPNLPFPVLSGDLEKGGRPYQEAFFRLGSIEVPTNSTFTINAPEDTSCIFWSDGRPRNGWPSREKPEEIALASYKLSITFTQEKEVKAHSK